MKRYSGQTLAYSFRCGRVEWCWESKASTEESAVSGGCDLDKGVAQSMRGKPNHTLQPTL